MSINSPNINNKYNINNDEDRLNNSDSSEYVGVGEMDQHEISGLQPTNNTILNNNNNNSNRNSKTHSNNKLTKNIGGKLNKEDSLFYDSYAKRDLEISDTMNQGLSRGGGFNYHSTSVSRHSDFQPEYSFSSNYLQQKPPSHYQPTSGIPNSSPHLQDGTAPHSFYEDNFLQYGEGGRGPSSNPHHGPQQPTSHQYLSDVMNQDGAAPRNNPLSQPYNPLYGGGATNPTNVSQQPPHQSYNRPSNGPIPNTKPNPYHQQPNLSSGPKYFSEPGITTQPSTQPQQLRQQKSSGGGVVDEDITDPTKYKAVDVGNGMVGYVKKKKPGRQKIPLVFIKNRLKRSVTFSKRKKGLMKKAYELCILTGSESLVILANDSGHVYTYATPKFKALLDSKKGAIKECLFSENFVGKDEELCIEEEENPGMPGFESGITGIGGGNSGGGAGVNSASYHGTIDTSEDEEE